MNHSHLDNVIRKAVDVGILPPTATRSSVEHRPWPVILLTGLGAWLAAIPFIGIVFVTMGDWLQGGFGLYFVGLSLLVGAILVLRKLNVALFLEQLAIPALLVGGVMLGLGLRGDFHSQLSAGLLALATLAVAMAVPHQWLRILLGAACCALTMFALWRGTYAGSTFQHWLALHAVMGVWLGTRWKTMPLAVESLSTGWGMALLAGLSAWSGMTFLLGASLHLDHGGTANLLMPGPEGFIAQAVSAVLAGLAVFAITRKWPTMQGPWFIASGLIMAGMSYIMPSLGAVLLVIAIAAAQQRWKTATAGGLAAAWIVGAFYYQAAMPLSIKALIMMATGALLASIAWAALRQRQDNTTTVLIPSGSRAARICIAATALTVLLVANIGIIQKESLISNSRQVYVELAPADPRSLMQGDFMRLAYRLPDADAFDPSLPSAPQLRVIGRLDERGVFNATAIVEDSETVLKPGELAIKLKQVASGLTIVSDAWYFKEGEAKRWESARYGEFRVDENGRALLVGLRGPNLEKL